MLEAPRHEGAALARERTEHGCRSFRSKGKTLFSGRVLMAGRTRSKLKILAALGENIYRTTKPFRHAPPPHHRRPTATECCVCARVQINEAKGPPALHSPLPQPCLARMRPGPP